MDKLLKQLTEIDAKIDAILAGDALTDESRASLASLESERAAVTERITLQRASDLRAEQRTALQAEADASRVATERAARTVASNRLTDDDANVTPVSRTVTAPNIVRHRAGVPKHFTRGTIAERQESAYRFGMFGLALLSMDVGRQYRNRAAEQWLEKNLAVHQSNNATGAHTLIPEEFMADVITLREQYGVARRLLNVQPMSSDTLFRPRRASGLTAYFTAEGSAGTTSNKTWNDVRLVAKDLMILSLWSSNVNADSAINFGDDLAKEITYAFSEKEDRCAFNGTGTSEFGGITGISTALTGTGTAGVATQGTGTTWSAIVLADFHNVVGLLPQFADTPNAAWLCHRTFYYGVMQKLEMAAGGVSAMEIASGDRRPRPLFLGYPVEFSQVWPSATAVTTLSVALGDYGQAAMFGDRQQEGIAFSDSATVDGNSTFERNLLAIRGTERFDINVHDVGSASVVGPVVGLKTGT